MAARISMARKSRRPPTQIYGLPFSDTKAPPLPLEENRPDVTTRESLLIKKLDWFQEGRRFTHGNCYLVDQKLIAKDAEGRELLYNLSPTEGYEDNGPKYYYTYQVRHSLEPQYRQNGQSLVAIVHYLIFKHGLRYTWHRGTLCMDFGTLESDHDHMDLLESLASSADLSGTYDDIIEKFAEMSRTSACLTEKLSVPGLCPSSGLPFFYGQAALAGHYLRGNDGTDIPMKPFSHTLQALEACRRRMTAKRVQAALQVRPPHLEEYPYVALYFVRLRECSSKPHAGCPKDMCDRYLAHPGGFFCRFCSNLAISTDPILTLDPKTLTIQGVIDKSSLISHFSQRKCTRLHGDNLDLFLQAIVAVDGDFGEPSVATFLAEVAEKSALAPPRRSKRKRKDKDSQEGRSTDTAAEGSSTMAIGDIAAVHNEKNGSGSDSETDSDSDIDSDDTDASYSGRQGRAGTRPPRKMRRLEGVSAAAVKVEEKEVQEGSQTPLEPAGTGGQVEEIRVKLEPDANL